MSHLRLVISIARQYQGYGLPFGDLIQEGNIGFNESRQTFQSEQRCAFGDFRNDLD